MATTDHPGGRRGRRPGTLRGAGSGGGTIAGCEKILATWTGAAGAVGCGLGWLATTGRLTLDLGWGRTLRALGPITIDVQAPAETVFDVIVQPYLGRATHAMSEKVKVLERTEAMVLAEHYTPLGGRLRGSPSRP